MPSGDRLRVNGRRSRHQRDQEGYTLAFLMVVVTIMNVAVAMALPSWTTFAQREKEQELVFRGLQYAEAIRVFQKTNNRLPITLEELYEKKPRSIRQLYPDPMTENGKWGLLIQSAAPTQAGRQPARGAQENRTSGGEELPRGVGFGQAKGAGSRASQAQAAQSANQGRRAGGGGNVVAIPPAAEESGGSSFGEPIQRTTGPIVGVYSAATGEAFRKFMNSSSYSEWQFKVDLIPIPAIVGGDQPAPRVTSAWIGKPFREDIQVQANRGAPNQGQKLIDGSGPDQKSGFRPAEFRPQRKN